MKNFIFTALLFLSLNSFCQTTTVDIKAISNPFDSTYVIQSSTTDSFHNGNHPGAGPYQNGEIYVCEGAILKYNYQMGTSSGPTFFLESKAKLILYGDLVDARIYLKDSAIIDCNGFNLYVIGSIKRVTTASIINQGSSSNYQDSVFTAINYTFTSWPGSLSPCINNTSIKDNNFITKFNLSPIPANQFLQITGNTNEIASVQIKNLLGETIYVQKENFENVNIQNLNTGIYFITLINHKNLSQTLKFIKE